MPIKAAKLKYILNNFYFLFVNKVNYTFTLYFHNIKQFKRSIQQFFNNL